MHENACREERKKGAEHWGVYAESEEDFTGKKRKKQRIKKRKTEEGIHKNTKKIRRSRGDLRNKLH